MGRIIIIAVSIQVKLDRFNPYIYWLTVIATTIVGTTLADFVDRSLGIGYLGGVTILLILLGVSLFSWYKTMGTVSIHSVKTPKSEAFYWLTIMFSQTLGTALGDWTADTAGLGYTGGIILFGLLLTMLALAYYFTTLSRTILFWGAFILTRPMGAVVGDFLDKPLNAGGLELSRYTASICLLIFVFGCVLVFPQHPAREKSTSDVNY